MLHIKCDMRKKESQDISNERKQQTKSNNLKISIVGMKF